MTWTTDGYARRGARWERADCLVERRKPREWRTFTVRRLQHPPTRRPWDEINPERVRPKPTPSPRNVDAAVFERLADQWESESAFESMVPQKVLHPAYQRIIGMGQPAIPLVLKRLRDKPAQWFWALTAMTGSDPASGEDTVEGAREAWLRWGREHELLGE